ncbi:hypothetical protein DL96DRAFT_1624811 [Flagelloscypha sp. PMI_526]|nr:hypothetical protein DL96DRAFT_1624811 [Flagelloscypha sp. PMI_526]
MSLPLLINNAECGPSNALQNLGKRFDQDRGVQQDHFNTARAGSSREVFRTTNQNVAMDEDAARFFGPANIPPPLQQQFHAPSPFQVSDLRQALPVHPQKQQPAIATGWASDFLHSTPQMNVTPVEKVSHPISSQMNASRSWTPTYASPHYQSPQFMGPMAMQGPPIQMQHQQASLPMSQNDQVSWDQAFLSRETPTVVAEPQSQSRSTIESEGDDLSRTAALLLQHVSQETNPKFAQSQFLSLMQKLRDREVIVEDNKVIENPNPGMTSTQVEGMKVQSQDLKGKGREIMGEGVRGEDGRFTEMDEQMGFVSRHVREGLGMTSPTNAIGGNAIPSRIGSVSGVWGSHPSDQAIWDAGTVPEVVDLATEQSQEPSLEDIHAPFDETEAYFRAENEDYIRYFEEQQQRRRAATEQTSSNQHPDWAHLQDAWDELEATSTGIRSIPNYPFMENNPYMLGEGSTRMHGIHLSNLDSVLELEAAVQHNMTSVEAWYSLGVKQQENEREGKAILALKRALTLDPAHLPSWLALAISSTNDNDRMGTYNAIKEWVERNEQYQGAAESFKLKLGNGTADKSMTEKFDDLVQCLIEMARSSTGVEVDADVQIALAVILNTIDDYAKSRDCFLAALAVRPDDWLLYNRVGATLANSGHSEQAVGYYHKALELNPAYIRARYNLGISCINLLRYDEGAQHILDALVLQDSDSVLDEGGRNETRGVTSTALWESLRTCCLHLARADLAGLCERRELDAFRIEFGKRG